MNAMRTPGRRRARFRAALGAVFAMIACGCLGPDEAPAHSLRIRNPELTAGMDSLRILGANARKADTLLILRWLKGMEFPSEVPYPPGLEAAFTLLVRGYVGETLVYTSRTVVSGNQAQAPVRDFRLAAPVLPDLPVTLRARVGDAIKLIPPWETRPGIYRQTDSGGPEAFTPDAVFAWTRGERLLGRDSVLAFAALTLDDAGTYLFAAGNAAGRDSLGFELSVRHMLPKIAEIKPQAVRIGKPLKVVANVTRSDSLLYRWMRDGVTASTDTALAFDSLGARDTGTYQLAVANASDTTETALSNRFAVAIAPEPVETWKILKAFSVGAQANTSLGTVLDLDAGRALFSSEAGDKQAVLDLLFVFSGGKLKLMSPVAAKAAGDLTYADAWDAARIKDVKFVATTGSFAAPVDGRDAFKKGTKVNSAVAAAGQGYLVQTTDGNLAWLRIESIGGGTTPSSSSSAALNVEIAPF